VEDRVLEFMGLDSGSGLTIGDFAIQMSPSTGLASREVSHISPFSLEDFLSGSDNGRDCPDQGAVWDLIRRKKSRLYREIPNDSQAKSRAILTFQVSEQYSPISIGQNVL
jgi:hypothetical protein